MKDKAREWFENLRSKLISTIEVHENARFTEKKWEHSGRGGGLMSKIEGSLIEKGGVNISTVSGQFSEKCGKEYLAPKQTLLLGNRYKRRITS